MEHVINTGLLRDSLSVKQDLILWADPKPGIFYKSPVYTGPAAADRFSQIASAAESLLCQQLIQANGPRLLLVPVRFPAHARNLYPTPQIVSIY